MTNKILVPDAKGLAEEHDAEPAIHHQPEGFSDRFALGVGLDVGPANQVNAVRHPARGSRE